MLPFFILPPIDLSITATESPYASHLLLPIGSSNISLHN
jgi:hypothetical protein